MPHVPEELCVCVPVIQRQKPRVYVNTVTWWNIKPLSKDKRHISINKRSTTKALYLINIKSGTLNTTSLVLWGSTLDSSHLLWFIRRCMGLFDVQSWEVLHLLEGERKKMLWKQEVDLPDSQKNTNRRKICYHGTSVGLCVWVGVCVYMCVYVWLSERLLCCFDIVCVMQQNYSCQIWQIYHRLCNLPIYSIMIELDRIGQEIQWLFFFLLPISFFFLDFLFYVCMFNDTSRSETYLEWCNKVFAASTYFFCFLVRLEWIR